MVEADPHAADYRRRIADKVRVLVIVGRAGLACSRKVESHPRRARGGPVAQHAFERAGDQVGRPRADDPLFKLLMIENEMALAIDHRFDRIRRRGDAGVREHLVRRGQLEQCSLVRADRDRQHRRQVFVDSKLVGRPDDRRRAEQITDVGGRNVERFRERVGDRDRAAISPLVIHRRPSTERHRAIRQDRRKRQRRRKRAALGVERSQINDRLEGRAGLALCGGRAIELAEAVVAPADHREDRAGPRVERDARAFEPVLRVSSKPPMIALEPLQIIGHAIRSFGLKLRIERGVGFYAGEITVEARDRGDHRGHVVGEIGSVAAAGVLRDRERRARLRNSPRR